MSTGEKFDRSEKAGRPWLACRINGGPGATFFGLEFGVCEKAVTTAGNDREA